MQFLLRGFIPIRVPSLDSLELGFQHIGGKDLLVAYVGGNAVVLGEKILPVPIPEAWQRRIGTWKPINIDGVDPIMQPAALRRDGDFLVFETKRREVGTSVRPLVPLDDQQALTAGTGHGMGETVRVKVVGSEERLMFSGYELVRADDGASTRGVS